MKARFLILVCLASMGTLPVLAASYTLQTPNTQMVLDATEGQELRMLYYGDKSATLADIEASGEQGSAAYPAFGDIDMIHLPALQVQHADGDLSLNLRVAQVEQQQNVNYQLSIINYFST